MLCQALSIISKSSVNSNWSYSPEMINSGKNWQFFVPYYLEIWQMTLKVTVTWVTARKCPIWVKIRDFQSCVTFKFDGWSQQTIRHLFYSTSSFRQHFVTICKFKLELWSGNAQIAAKFALTCVTLSFDIWPWPFTWTLHLSMVITPENFIMIPWEEHSEEGVTDRRLAGQKEVFPWGRKVLYKKVIQYFSPPGEPYITSGSQC